MRQSENLRPYIADMMAVEKQHVEALALQRGRRNQQIPRRAAVNKASASEPAREVLEGHIEGPGRSRPGVKGAVTASGRHRRGLRQLRRSRERALRDE